MPMATFGYGVGAVKTKRKKAEIFKDCLESEGVSLLLDIRYSPWGGYWNPKQIQRILESSSVAYLFKETHENDEEDGYIWHKIFGAPKKIRDIEPFSAFREAYTQELFTYDEPLAQLASLIQNETLVAVMCCEEYIPTHDNCHRFVLADLMVEKGYLAKEEIRHIDMANYCP